MLCESDNRIKLYRLFTNGKEETGAVGLLFTLSSSSCWTHVDRNGFHDTFTMMVSVCGTRFDSFLPRNCTAFGAALACLTSQIVTKALSPVEQNVLTVN